MTSLTSHWTLDPSLIYVSLAAVLYWAGGAREGVGGVPFRSAASRRERRLTRLRELSFVLGLATIIIALCSPIDYYSDELFWVHMGQHLMLLTVAPPLILLGRPWPRMWRAIPIGTRTKLGRSLAQGEATRPLRWLCRPVQAWVIFNVNILVWHIPGVYDATLKHQWFHDCEHTTYFFFGLLFWAYLIDPGPLRDRMKLEWKLAYVISAMIIGWLIAITLVLFPHPIYSHYIDLSYRPGGISELEDQQIAGGMMWVPGSISYTLYIFYAFAKWATPTQKTPAPRATVTT